MHSFSFVEMWQSMGLLARAVVIVLALMSIFSLGVIVERLYTFARARRQSIAYLGLLRGYLSGRKLHEAGSVPAAHEQSPIARIARAGIAEYVEGRTQGTSDIDLADLVDRLLERLKDRETAELRRGLGTLATVGSSAPFVGLFGTVVGIINAFRAMAVTNSGGLGSVSAGIAEALVTTAFGLLVAIPAVWMFNYLSGRVESFVVDMNDVASELVDYVAKEASRASSGGRAA